MKKSKIAGTVSAISFTLAVAVSSYAAEFDSLAGTYAGKTAKGNAIVIVVPKKGIPSYSFAGSDVRVSNAKVTGKTIIMNVGPEGLGRVTITTNAKGAAYKYTDGKGNTLATL